MTINNCQFNNNTAGDGCPGSDSCCGGGPGGNGGDGGAIYNTGITTIMNCQFNNNTAGNGGIGGSARASGSSGSGGNGGAIYNTCSLNIYNSTFNNNTAGNGANGRNSWYGGNGGNGGNGGAIYNTGNITMTNSLLFDNNAGNKGTGGEGWYDWGGWNGTDGNDGKGGAIYNTGTSEIHYCTIIGNTASQGDNIYCESPGFVNAILNWWGTNNPQEINASVVGNVTYTPWLWLIVNPNQTYIEYIVNSPFITNIITNLAPNSSEDFLQMTGNFVKNYSIGSKSSNQDQRQNSPDGLIVMGLTILLGMIWLFYQLNLL